MTHGPGAPWGPGPDGAGTGQPPAAEPAPWATPAPAPAQPAHGPQPEPPAQVNWGWNPAPAEPVAEAPVATVAGDGAAPAAKRARTKLPRVPWRRFAAAGLVLLALGLVGGGFAAGWASHAALGTTPDGDTTVEVVAAPDAADAMDTALPDVRGLSSVDARQAIADVGLAADAITAVDTPSAQEAGTVVRQDPIGGTAGAGAVTLYVAVPGQVPALVGQSGDDADQVLTGLGVRVERKQVYDPAIAEGTVTSLDPPAGSPLPLLVTVTVAGPASSLYLEELDAIDGGCSSGETAVNGQSFQHSVYCSPSSYSDDEQVTTYLLNRLTSSVEGVIGVTDQSDPGLTADVALVGDGRVLWAGSLRYGQAAAFTADTRGVLRLEIRYRATSEGESGSFALGDVRAVGSPVDITTLSTQ